jgi:outer membrane lipoprotein LolB
VRAVAGGRTPGGALLLGLVLALPGCALQPAVPGTSIAWQERRAALLALNDWELGGRIGVKSSQGGGQGRLEWRQAGDAAVLRVSGPFGAGSWELRWDGSEAVLTKGGGEVALQYTGADALDRMLSDQVGWQFPAEQTRYWVLGIAAPGSRSRPEYGLDGWLEALDQDGWRVAFAGFEERSGYWMPRKITVEGKDARLRLVVDRWLPGISN